MLQVNNEYNELVRLAHDRRVKKVVVFDTETTPYYETVEPYWINGCSVIPCKENGIYNVLQYEPYVHGNKAYYKYLTDKKCKQIVFDFGYTIATKKGVILEKRNFLVREVFMDMALMKNAYYFEKYPLYLDMLQNGSIEMKSWNEIVSILYKDFTEYNMHEAYAYNIAFDLGALHNTNHYVNQKPFLLWKMLDVKTNCLWGMACETLLQQKAFKKIAIEQGWVTPTGNISTSAETCYKYITQCYGFEESHTALDDSIIETEIMARCFKTHKKMNFGIIKQPWRLVNIKESE